MQIKYFPSEIPKVKLIIVHVNKKPNKIKTFNISILILLFKKIFIKEKVHLHFFSVSYLHY